MISATRRSIFSRASIRSVRSISTTFTTKINMQMQQAAAARATNNTNTSATSTNTQQQAAASTSAASASNNSDSASHFNSFKEYRAFAIHPIDGTSTPSGAAPAN